MHKPLMRLRLYLVKKHQFCKMVLAIYLFPFLTLLVVINMKIQTKEERTAVSGKQMATPTNTIRVVIIAEMVIIVAPERRSEPASRE